MAGTLTASVIKNDTTSPPTFQNSAGTEIGTLCRAWVRFLGSSGTISSSFNVSSVTVNATGDYSVNFTNAMPDTNYAVTGATQNGSGGAATQVLGFGTFPLAAYSTSSARVQTRDIATNSAVNGYFVHVAIFR